MHADADARSDQELLVAHVHGDRNAFGELFRRHRDRLWSVAVRTIGNPDEAADALQDAMLAALRGAAGFRGDSAVTTWLHRVVVNACLDRLRRRAARPVSVAPIDPERHAEAGPPMPDPIEVRDLRLALSSALATLPVEQRAALVLVDMEGYSVDEAAHLLDVPPGTIKSRCARARVKLMPLLAELRPGAPDAGGPARPGLDADPRNQPRGPHVQTTQYPTATATARLPQTDRPRPQWPAGEGPSAREGGTGSHAEGGGSR
jgi:RNA polymerase sigma-70 factor (ECF subfamily)